MSLEHDNIKFFCGVCGFRASGEGVNHPHAQCSARQIETLKESLRLLTEDKAAVQAGFDEARLGWHVTLDKAQEREQQARNGRAKAHSDLVAFRSRIKVFMQDMEASRALQPWMKTRLTEIMNDLGDW